MPTYYLGLDVHKVRAQYCLMDPIGGILREGNVPTEMSCLSSRIPIPRSCWRGQGRLQVLRFPSTRRSRGR